MAQSADTVMTQIVRETYPDISDADIPQAMTQIDQSDPRIPARIFGGVFYGSERSSESSVNTYHCRGTGRAGDGILKSTPGFEKKGASTSSQVAHLTFHMQRLAEENARMRQYQSALVDWQQAVADVQHRNNARQRQWFRDFMTAQAQGLPAPPEPEDEPQPPRPTPPVQQQQEDPQHEEVDQQQQHHEGGEQQLQDEGGEQEQPDDDVMVDLGLDFD